MVLFIKFERYQQCGRTVAKIQLRERKTRIIVTLIYLLHDELGCQTYRLLCIAMLFFLLLILFSFVLTLRILFVFFYLLRFLILINIELAIFVMSLNIFFLFIYSVYIKRVVSKSVIFAVLKYFIYFNKNSRVNNFGNIDLES